MSTDCGLIDNIAGNLVSDGWSQWRTYANTALQDTADFFSDLEELQFTPIQTNISFPVPPDLGDSFQKPTVPEEPELEYNDVTKPGDVYIPPIVLPDPTSPPSLGATPPDLQFPTAPGEFTDPAPDDPPSPSLVTLPDPPVINLPTVPDLRDITLPTVPTVELPAFTATAPVINAVAPDMVFNFKYTDYENSLPTLITQVQTMLAGGTGIPDEIWDALWDKARAREVLTATQLVQEVTDEWASRGFSLPNGVLDKKIEGARQANQDAANQLSRDIAIQQATMEVENLKFAVAQGIALENAYIGLHVQKMQISFETARTAIETAISMFNAKVAKQNLELQAYATDVQVYKTLIEAEMTNVELYRAQLEGQRVISELNVQDIEVYKARLSGLLTHVEIYKGELDGVRALIEVDKNKVDTFTARVNAFIAQIGAKEAEVKLYSEKINAQLAKAQVYSTEVNAYAQLVQAYKAGEDSIIARQRLSLENNGLTLEKFRTQIQKYAAETDGEAKRIAAGVGVYAGQARMYTAELSAEQARVLADSRQYDLALETGKTQAELEVQEARLNIEQLLRLLNLELDKNKTVLGVQAQLAASAMSAVNLSAAVQDSASNSTSCTSTYSYEGN